MFSRAHLKLLKWCILGQIKKALLNLKPYAAYSQHKKSTIVVSLTSYGRRVNKTVYFTILSILNQSLPPKKIILWLDSDNWNNDNIPSKLKKLVEYNLLEINYTEDIRSFKKLIPTLKLYPDDVIVTVDDDVIYSKFLLEKLYGNYLSNPNSIYCTRASVVEFINGKPKPYKTWESAKSNKISYNSYLFPVGIGGVLYPPHALAKETLDKKKFMELCPEADDIWFWRMAKLNGFSHTYVSLYPNIYPFDAIYQAFHRGSALTHSNVGNNKNDIQLERVLKAYPL